MSSTVEAIERGADVRAMNAKGMSALHLAAAGIPFKTKSVDRVDLCMMLVERGADVNVGQSAGFTPLVAACFVSNARCGNALLALGADTRCLSGESPEGMRLLLLDRLQAAAALNHPGLILFAMENDWDQETLPDRVSQAIEWAQAEPGDLSRGVHTLRAWMAQWYARFSLLEVGNHSAARL